MSTPNATTWERTAALLCMMPPGDFIPTLEIIGRAMLAAGHDPAFIAAELQYFGERYFAMRAAELCDAATRRVH